MKSSHSSAHASWPQTYRRLVLIGCAAIAVTAVASTSAAPASRSAVPHSLVGTWGKTITAATWKKQGITYEKAGHWGLKVTASGVSSIVEPPGKPDTPPLTTMHTIVTGGSIVFGPTADGFCPGNATYHWKSTGRVLTLTLVSDGCTARLVFLSGTWARTS